MFRMFQSETFVVYDCLLKELDSATYELTTPSTSQLIVKNYKLSSQFCFTAPFCFEFDVESITNPNGLRLRIMEEDTTPIYLSNFNTLGVTGACHIKCIVTETGTEWFVDGVSKYTASGVPENPFGISLIVLPNNTGSITVKNAVVYPI